MVESLDTDLELPLHFVLTLFLSPYHFLYLSLVASFVSPTDKRRWMLVVTGTLVACQLRNQQETKGSLSQGKKKKRRNFQSKASKSALWQGFQIGSKVTEYNLK